MTNNIVFVPFSRDLYDDVVKFSGGSIDPVGVAEDALRSWIQDTIEEEAGWGRNRMAVAKKYAPHVFDQMKKQQEAQDAELDALFEEERPMVWREVMVSANTKVRMAYGGTHHYAEVKGGRIVDESGAYTPSEWASKVAGGTSRNAWRDLWFLEPGAKTWVPAQFMRDQARKEIGRD